MTEERKQKAVMEFMTQLNINPNCANCKNYFNCRCKLKEKEVDARHKACNDWNPNNRMEFLTSIYSGDKKNLNIDTEAVAKRKAAELEAEMKENERRCNELRPDKKTWESEIAQLNAELAELKSGMKKLERDKEAIRTAKHKDESGKTRIYIKMEREVSEKMLDQQELIDLKLKAIKDKRWEMEKWDYWVPEPKQATEEKSLRHETMQEYVNRTINYHDIYKFLDGSRYFEDKTPSYSYQRKNHDGHRVKSKQSEATIVINHNTALTFDGDMEYVIASKTNIDVRRDAVRERKAIQKRLERQHIEDMIKIFESVLRTDPHALNGLIESRNNKLEYWKGELKKWEEQN